MTPSTVRGVTVLGPSAPDYAAAVNRILGAGRPAPLNAWLPYGIVLRNGAAQTIVAIAVRWEVTPPAGAPGRFVMTQEAFDQARRQVAPGKAVVAIPPLVLNGARLPPEFAFFSSADLSHFQSARSIRVNLDGVVFASGQFVGPDTAQEYESYRADTEIPPQVAAKVLAMRDAGVPIAGVVEWLQTAAASRSTRDPSIAVTARAARQLLGEYRRKGERALWVTAESASKAVIQVHR